MKIFVTGATGYLGYHFVNVAVSRGHKVLCLRRPTSVSLFEPIVEQQIQWVNNNDEAKLRETVNAFQPDVLFHAAWSGVRGFDRDNTTVQQANVDLSCKMFELYPYKQIIALGSQAEYGVYRGVAYESQEAKPVSPYAKAKLQVAQELYTYCEPRDMEWQWIRLFTVFGEKLTGGLIKLITERCLTGEEEFDTTEGLQRYAYLYTYDFARAVCRVLGSKGKSGIYNLSQPTEVHTNREILNKVKEILSSDIQLNFGALPYEKNQVMYMDGCVTKFENAFGAIPHTDFEEALEKTVESVKSTFIKK